MHQSEADHQPVHSKMAAILFLAMKNNKNIAAKVLLTLMYCMLEVTMLVHMLMISMEIPVLLRLALHGVRISLGIIIITEHFEEIAKRLRDKERDVHRS